MSFNLDKPSKEEALKNIRDLPIPSHEMDNLSNIIMGCSKFNNIHRSLLHFSLALKACLDMEKEAQEETNPDKWSTSTKIEIEGDE